MQEHMVQEARALAVSRLTMHKIGQKDSDEYRAQIEDTINDSGFFLEDEESMVDVEIETQMSGYEEWYADYLSRMWEGAKTDG